MADKLERALGRVKESSEATWDPKKRRLLLNAVRFCHCSASAVGERSKGNGVGVVTTLDERGEFHKLG